MPGPAPKHPSVRARTNKVTSAASLSRDPALAVPELPEHPWHAMTVRWWDDIWASPMAPEYDNSDQHGLFALAYLVDDFWTAERSTDRVKLAAEIRQQGQRFGLSPIDRRRLQWEIERTDEAQDRGNQRRRRTITPPAVGDDDPRSVLRAVN